MIARVKLLLSISQSSAIVAWGTWIIPAAFA